MIEYGILGGILAVGALTMVSNTGQSVGNTMCSAANGVGQSNIAASGSNNSNSIAQEQFASSPCQANQISDSYKNSLKSQYGQDFSLSTHPTTQEMTNICNYIITQPGGFDNVKECLIFTSQQYSVQGDNAPVIQDLKKDIGYTPENEDQDVATIVNAIKKQQSLGKTSLFDGRQGIIGSTNLSGLTSTIANADYEDDVAQMYEKDIINSVYARAYQEALH